MSLDASDLSEEARRRPRHPVRRPRRRRRGGVVDELRERRANAHGAVPLARPLADAFRHADSLQHVHHVVQATTLHAQTLGERIHGNVSVPLRGGAHGVGAHRRALVRRVELTDDTIGDGRQRVILTGVRRPAVGAGTRRGAPLVL